MSSQYRFPAQLKRCSRIGWPRLPLTPHSVSISNRAWDRQAQGRGEQKRDRSSPVRAALAGSENHLFFTLWSRRQSTQHTEALAPLCAPRTLLSRLGTISAAMAWGHIVQGHLSFSSCDVATRTSTLPPSQERWTQVLFVFGMKSSWFLSSHSQKGQSVGIAGLTPLHATRM